MKLFTLVEKATKREYIENNGKFYLQKKRSLETLESLVKGVKIELGASSYPEVEIKIPSITNESLTNISFGLPIEPKEIWGSGISYYVSRNRYSEEDVAKIGSETIYQKVYSAERPEIFFKGTASRCVSHGGKIAIRSDSNWTLPEPELAVVISSDGKILGYTVFDDVSARDIESENPLYLPESKIYNGSCAFGPFIVTEDEVQDPYSLDIMMKIERGGKVYFEGKTSTNNMKTKINKQIKYLIRDNSVPDGTILTTGTSIVPGRNQGLMDGDRVTISIDKIGTLITDVVKLKENA